MTNLSSLTLQSLIDRYFAQRGTGSGLAPEQFIAGWPQFREPFLASVAEREAEFPPVPDQANATDTEQGTAAPPLDAGPTVAGYRLGPQIARGGMSRIHCCRRVSDGMLAAIKLLDANVYSSTTLEQRFRREAEAIRSLDHPHIVPLLDYGQDQHATYLVLKLIEGCTLADVIDAIHHARASLPNARASTAIIERSGARSETSSAVGADPEPTGTPAGASGASPTESSLTSPRVTEAIHCFQAACRHENSFKDLAELIATAADALHAAHRCGIVHRDVKPSNLMLDRSGHLWLTDFGLASLGDAQTALTMTGQLVGTPYYMSPEQAAGQLGRIDRRSDVYSLGTTLYELVTGRRPFPGDRVQVLAEISRGRLTPPSQVTPSIPKPLEAIILKAMARSPRDRYGSASEMAADLRRFAADQSVTARIPGPADRVVRWLADHPRRSLRGAAALAAAIVLAVGLQSFHAQRLSGINARLAKSNRMLKRSIGLLGKSNADLEQSRSQLRRHLYVADMASAYRAYAQREIDAVQQLLARHVPPPPASNGPPPADLRGFEWWLLANLSRPPESLKWRGHQGAATEILAIPGTHHAATAGHDGRVCRWNLKNGRLRGEFHVGPQLDALAISPDGKRVVVGRNVPEGLNAVSVRSLATGEVDVRLRGHQYSVESAAFSPDGQWIATAGRYHEVLLHRADGSLQSRLMTESRNESLAFSPNGESLLAVKRHRTGADKDARLTVWQLPDLREPQTIPLGFDPLVFAFSRDGRRLVAADAGHWQVMTWPEQRPVATRGDIRGRVRCVGLDPSGETLAAGCDNGLVYLWRLSPQALRQSSPDQPAPRVITTGERMVTSVALTGQRRLLATSQDGVVRTYALEPKQPDPVTFGTPIDGARVCRETDDSVLLRTPEGRVERLDLGRGSVQPVLDVQTERDCALAISSDGQRVAAAIPGGFVVANLNAPHNETRIDAGLNQEPIVWLEFVDRDRRLLVLFNDRLRSYHTRTWEQWAERAATEGGARQLLVSPDGRSLLVLLQEALHWYDVQTLSLTRRRGVRWSAFRRACYSPHGERIAVGHHDGTIEILRSDDAECVMVLRGHQAAIHDLTFIAQGRTLVSAGDDQTIRFWDAESGRSLGTLPTRRSFPVLFFDERRQRLLAMGPGSPVTAFSGPRDAENGGFPNARP